MKKNNLKKRKPEPKASNIVDNVCGHFENMCLVENENVSLNIEPFSYYEHNFFEYKSDYDKSDTKSIESYNSDNEQSNRDSDDEMYKNNYTFIAKLKQSENISCGNVEYSQEEYLSD